MASIGYFVTDVDAAMAFYTEKLGFKWNRLVIEVKDLPARVAQVKQAGVRFRDDIVVGPGGRQRLAEDPDGNPVEFLEP